MWVRSPTKRRSLTEFSSCLYQQNRGYHGIMCSEDCCKTGGLCKKDHIKSGLEITAGQRTMSGLIGALTGQTLDLPVMLTSQI